MILGVIFAALLVGFFAYGIYEAREFPRLAKIFPYWISVVALAMAVIQLAIDLKNYLLKTEDARASFVDLSPDRSLPSEVVFKRAGGYFLWFVAFYFAIWLLGFVIAMSLFLVTFLRYDAALSWLHAISLAIAGLAFVVAVSWVLSLYWPEGVIAGWIDLPWPLR